MVGQSAEATGRKDEGDGRYRRERDHDMKVVDCRVHDVVCVHGTRGET